MVKYITILKVIAEEIQKCSNDDIKTKLAKLTQEEKDKRLSEIFFPPQMEQYHELVEELEICRSDYENYKDWETADVIHDGAITLEIDEEIESEEETRRFWKDIYESAKEGIDEFEEKVFDYERKIFEKQETPLVEEFDDSSYEIDTDVATLERRQIKSQEKVHYTKSEENSLKAYFGYDYDVLNSYLNDGQTWNGFTKEYQEELKPKMDKMSQHLSNAIKKNTLTQDTVVWHGGRFDFTKWVGDTITMKGFTSTSYDIESANKFVDTNDKIIYKILLPKGTPCVSANGVVNGESLTNVSSEHELLLDKNFKAKIVNITDNIVTVQAI